MITSVALLIFNTCLDSVQSSKYELPSEDDLNSLNGGSVGSGGDERVHAATCRLNSVHQRAVAYAVPGGSYLIIGNERAVYYTNH